MFVFPVGLKFHALTSTFLKFARSIKDMRKSQITSCLAEGRGGGGGGGAEM